MLHHGAWPRGAAGCDPLPLFASKFPLVLGSLRLTKGQRVWLKPKSNHSPRPFLVFFVFKLDSSFIFPQGKGTLLLVQSLTRSSVCGFCLDFNPDSQLWEDLCVCCGCQAVLLCFPAPPAVCNNCLLLAPSFYACPYPCPTAFGTEQTGIFSPFPACQG